MMEIFLEGVHYTLKPAKPTFSEDDVRKLGETFSEEEAQRLGEKAAKEGLLSEEGTPRSEEELATDARELAEALEPGPETQEDDRPIAPVINLFPQKNPPPTE